MKTDTPIEIAAREAMANRLSAARIAAGYANPKAASERFGWNENTYKSHENGMRGIKPERAKEYARAFNVNVLDLLLGGKSRDNFRPQGIPIMGRVGAGQEVLPEFEQVPEDGFGEVDVPFFVGTDAIAFEVEGDSMWPRYDPGDLVICMKAGRDPQQLVGREVALRTTDGRRFIKRLRMSRSRPGLFDLDSHNREPIENISIAWASEIVHVARRDRWLKRQ